MGVALFVGGFGVSTASASPIAIDLTTAGATFTGVDALGGAFTVQQVDKQSTGTGVIDSFLRIQQNRVEQGYNTSLSTPLDDKGGNFTRALSLSEVPILDIAGTLYRQFLLDINQIDSQSLLSLNQIQIFQSTTDRDDHVLAPGTTTEAATLSFAGAGWLEAFRLSTGGAGYELILDSGLNSGSGRGDMFLYVADSLFAAGYSNVIFYSQFGHLPGVNAANGGFEEWAVLKSPAQPCVGCEPDPTGFASMPESGSLVLLGSGLLLTAIGMKARERRRVSRQ